MTGRSRNIFFWKHLPLTACSQNIEDTIKYLSVWYNWPTYRLWWFFFRQCLLKLIPQLIWNRFDSRKILVINSPCFFFLRQDTGHSLGMKMGSYNPIEFWDRLLICKANTLYHNV